MALGHSTPVYVVEPPELAMIDGGARTEHDVVFGDVPLVVTMIGVIA
jgi:hypothetical protein